MSGPSSNPGDPIAYFITWTTYGTWLPGDERGWCRKGEAGIHDPNRFLFEFNRARMKEAEFRLSLEQRNIVEQTIRKHCEIRNWTLDAVNARSNHIHLVVTANGYSPEDVRNQLKAWCTRAIKNTALIRQRFWTEGADCEKLYDEAELEAAVIYVLEAQDRKGLEEP
jgi:REP element-mobilizing transposase RayT